MKTPPLHTRAQFWGEKVAAETGSVLNKRQRKGRETAKWSNGELVDEIIRTLGSCGHLKGMALPPTDIYGLRADQLHDHVKHINAASRNVLEEYERKGRTGTRKQKTTTPTMLFAVASYPEPNMMRTDARDRWVQLVIDAVKERWGDCVQSIVAHSDEAFFHLHIIASDEGRPVKPLHLGHACAAEVKRKGRDRKQQATGYKIGVTMAQDWYHSTVGSLMGWARKLAPRPRLSRTAAMRRRQEEQEQRELEILEADKAVAQAVAQVQEQAKLISDAARRLEAREAKLVAKENAYQEHAKILARMRGAIEDQYALEQMLKRVRYEGPSVLF
jgi:hypothetical protein